MKCFCGASHATLLFRAGSYNILQCTSCDQVRTEARTSAKRTGYYEEEDVQFYIDHQEIFRSLFRKLLGFIYKYAPKGTFLDIGAGVGLLLDEARHMGYRVIGLEPSQSSVKAAKNHFGIKLIQKEFLPGVITKKVDIILLNHVLEHLSNPREVIGLCANTLRAGGILVIGVPNFDSFMCRIKKGRWQSLIPAQHRWQFTLAALDRLVTPHGFRRIAVSYDNHDRSMHYWWKKPIYRVLDRVAIATGHAEAMVVIYRKD